MRTVLLIGHNGLRLFLRNKAGYVWLFLVPLVFVYFFGVSFRGPGNPANPQPVILVDNQDAGFIGKILIEQLEGVRIVDKTKREEAERGLRIPTDFTEKILKTTPVKAQFFQIKGAETQAGFLIEVHWVRALIALNAALFELGSQNPPLINEANLRAALNQKKLVTLNARFAGREPTPAGFNQSLPGTLVQFLMMNLLIFGGASIAEERASGVLRRLAVYPIHRWELVIGKVYGRFLLGLVQIVFFLVLGVLIFKVNLGRNLPAITLTLGLYSWTAASLGVWIGAVVKSEDKIIGLCVLASIIMAALGGCWWPMEIVPETMKTIGHLVPTGWAMDALHQLISFGGGWSNITTPLAVLALFAAAANFGAAKTLRY